MVFVEALLEMAAFLWSERVFLVSLATLIALISLNVIAYRYKRKKEEPARFELDKAHLDDNGYALSIRIKNVGDGECETFKIVNLGYYVGPEKRGLDRPQYPFVDNHIDPGEYTETSIKPSPGFDGHRDEKRVFVVYYEADGVQDRILIMPDELMEQHWAFSESA